MQAAQKIVKNIFSLSIAELASKGIVFLWTAILAREIGQEGFGMIGFANTFTNYFILFVTLGFNTIGAREIAKYLDKINKYANTIVTTRLLLAVVGFVVLVFSVLFLNRSEESKIIIIISGTSLFSNAILLEWVYQGTERMEILALRQVVVNILNLIGIIVFVHNREDTILAMIIISAALFLNSLWMLAVYHKIYGRLRLLIDITLLKDIWKSALPLTISNLFITILNTFNIIVLGLLKGDQATGIYFAAFKILTLCMLPASVIQFAFFPLLSRAQTMEEKRTAVSKFTLLLAVSATITTVMFFTYSEFSVITVFGNEFLEASTVLKILMVSTFFAYINVAMNVPLIAWKMEKQAMIAIIIGSSFNIILNFIVIPIYSYNGAALAALASEFGVSIGLSYFFFKHLKKFYLVYYFKLLLIGILSGSLGYYAMILNIHTFVAIAITFSIFVIIVFAFKIISIEDIKKYIFHS